VSINAAMRIRDRRGPSTLVSIAAVGIQGCSRDTAKWKDTAGTEQNCKDTAGTQQNCKETAGTQQNVRAQQNWKDPAGTQQKRKDTARTRSKTARRQQGHSKMEGHSRHTAKCRDIAGTCSKIVRAQQGYSNCKHTVGTQHK